MREAKAGLRKREHREIAAGMNPPQAVNRAHQAFMFLLLFFPFLIKSDVEKGSVGPFCCVEHVVQCHSLCFS